MVIWRRFAECVEVVDESDDEVFFVLLLEMCFYGNLMNDECKVSWCVFIC